MIAVTNVWNFSGTNVILNRGADNVISDQLRTLAISRFSTRKWKPSESLICIDQIVSLGQIGLLAGIRGTVILTVRECIRADRRASTMRIVLQGV